MICQFNDNQRDNHPENKKTGHHYVLFERECLLYGKARVKIQMN